MNVLVIASAAKTGGALTILESFVKAASKTNNTYYIISPKKPKSTSSNVFWIPISTDGVGTMLFTLVFSYYYYLKYSCKSSISLNNFNFIFPCKYKVTYFHNLLIISSKNLRFKVIKFILKFLWQSKSHFVFQTSYVSSLFKEKVSPVVSYSINWPGVSLPTIKVGKNRLNKIVVPIPDIMQLHKNFNLVKVLAKSYPDIDFFIPDDQPQNSSVFPSNIVFSGKMNRNELLALISESEGVLVTSTEETICLPIFEALSLGRRAFVYKMPYIEHIVKDLALENCIHLFSNVDEFKYCYADRSYKLCQVSLNQIKEGNWEFIDVQE